MIGGTSKPGRFIHVIGTKGELAGSVDEGMLTVMHPDPRPGHEYSEEKVEIDNSGSGHGGGDMGLMKDFVRVLRDQEPSISTTSLEDSIYGHLIGFRADEAMDEGKVVEISIP
jgi:hypothetical protein